MSLEITYLTEKRSVAGKKHNIFTFVGALPKSGSEMLLLGILFSPVHSLMGSIETEGINEDTAIVD